MTFENQRVCAPVGTKVVQIDQIQVHVAKFVQEKKSVVTKPLAGYQEAVAGDLLMIKVFIASVSTCDAVVQEGWEVLFGHY